MALRNSDQLKAYFAERKAIAERRISNQKNPEQIKQQEEKYKQYQKEYQKQYREKHKQEIQQKATEYRQRNKEYLREYNRRWYHNQPKPDITDFPPPPVSSKKQVNQIYSNWLNQLKEREQYLTGEALQYNILMQESIMGRTKLSDSTAEKRYKSLTKLCAELIEKRNAMDSSNEEYNSLTRQISILSQRINYLRRAYKTVVPQKQTKKEEPKIKDYISNSQKSKFKEIKEKALKQIAEAKAAGNEKEAKTIQYQLQMTELRLKYSY